MKLISILATALITVGTTHAAAAAAATSKAAAGSGTAGTAATTAAAAAAPSTTVTIGGQQFVYPAMDVVPNVQDPIVQGWLKEIDLSKVPVLPVSNGGKVNTQSANCNPPTVVNPDQGSWTCQKYVAPTDTVSCPKAQVWGLTYDDGPSVSTPQLLAKLSALKIHATFFDVGSRVISNPDIAKSEYSDGHQIAVHTWSHPALTSLTNEQIVAELKWTMKAIKDVIGVTPRYMRPPYGDTDNRVRAVAKACGLETIIWTDGFDTDDWSISAQKPPNVNTTHVTSVFQSWQSKIASMSTGFIVLEHDLFPATVMAALAVLDIASKQSGLTIQSVAECIGDTTPYIETHTTSAKSVSGSNSTASGTGTASAATATTTAKSSADIVSIGTTLPILVLALLASALNFL